MGFCGERILLLIMATLMFMPQMRNLDGASSPLSISVIVVAFDVALLSNALNSFVTKDGGKDSFDLVICVPDSQLTDDALGDVVLQNALGFRTLLSNCSEINPPSPSDYTQLLYMIIPKNKTEIGRAIQDISKVYHVIKKTFYSTRVGQLLWMPLFLVIWPDFEDYCQNETSTKRLVQSFSPPFINDEFDNGVGPTGNSNVYESFSVNSDVYIYFGSECDGLEDNVMEVYSLSSRIINVQKLTPDNRKYESMFEGLLGRVRRRLDLQNCTIQAINSRDPSSFLEGPEEGTFDPLEIINGTPRVVFSELKQSLNFSEKIIVSDWISRFSNGTLKGTTASLFREGLADVTISVSSLLPYRKTELSFLQPTYANNVNGFFVQPAASTLRDIVIKPFSFGLWISLFITYLIIIVSILCFGWVYKKMHATNNTRLPDYDSTFKNELLLWAVGAITQQGWYKSPLSNAIRYAYILGNYLGFICYGAFSAAIVSILAVELVPIKSTSDLLNSDLIFYADDKSSTMAYVVDYLRANSNVKFGNRVTIGEGVTRLQSKDPSCYLAFPHYFYLSALKMDILSESWICTHLSILPVTTVETPSSMVVPRNSVYAELFNFMILKMKRSGLNHRFVYRYNAVTQAKCSKEISQIFHPLGIQDVFTAGLILLGGMLFGAILLLLERAFQLLNCIRLRYTTARSQSQSNVFAESW